MKDFINWLRNNDKIGKVVIWLFIITIGLIIINTALTSLGLPHYVISTNNVNHIKFNKVIEEIVSCIISILNFYSIILLVFSVKKYKKIGKYALLYLISITIVNYITNYAITQIYIICYILLFCYLFSGKQKKYIAYGMVAVFINAVVQYIYSIFKFKLIDASSLSDTEKIIIGFDYFIIMAIIILVKEFYLKKRGEKNVQLPMLSMVRPIQKRSNNSQKTSTKSHKSKKVTKN